MATAFSVLVMCVDAELVATDAGGDDFANDARNLMGHGAAIGVAQDRPARACIKCGADASQRIGRIGFVAVEEMLAVDHRFATPRGDGFDTVFDGLKIFVIRDAERDTDVEVPAFGDETNRVSISVKNLGETGIVGGAAACPLGHAESGELGVL